MKKPSHGFAGTGVRIAFLKSFAAPNHNQTEVCRSLDRGIGLVESITASSQSLRPSCGRNSAGLRITCTPPQQIASTRGSQSNHGSLPAGRTGVWASREGRSRTPWSVPFRANRRWRPGLRNSRTLQLGQCARTNIASSIPDRAGITTSEISRSGASSRAASKASRGRVNALASKPA